jgi:hypothetical protein
MPQGHLPGSGEEFANNLRDAFNDAPNDVNGYCKVDNPTFPTKN